MVNMKDFLEMFGKDVFTDKGVFCGRIENIDIDLEKFRVSGFRVEAARGSFLANMIGSKRGIVVPFNMVQSIGDVVIIKHISPEAVEAVGGEEEAELKEEERGEMETQAEQPTKQLPPLRF